MDWHLKYRPKTIQEIIGHKDVVKSLASVIDKKQCHAFLFTGPAGTGKTTLARIVAAEYDCDPANIVEVDAATYNGIDSMRELTQGLQYSPIGGGSKFIILDEAHALSKQGWTALLKSVEEPPEYVYWCFCTTDCDKVPKNIQSRCVRYNLKPLSLDDMFDVLDVIRVGEKLNVVEEVQQFIAENSDGSPRRAITAFMSCHGAKNIKEAANLMEKVASEKEAVDLARLMIKPPFKYQDAAAIVKSMKCDGETIRRVVLAYFTTAALSASEKSAPYMLTVLEAFKEPYRQPDQLGEVLLSIGEVLFAQ